VPNKAFSLKLNDLTDVGEFFGVASVYGEQDLGDDVCDVGCFDKTLASAGNQRPLMLEHKSPIGLVTLESNGVGLLATGKLSMGVAAAKDAYQLLRDGVMTGLSIGYSTVKDNMVGNVRHLTELKLWEVSLVTFPMLPSAQVSSVKAAEEAAQRAAEQAAIARALRDFRNEVKKLR
jgi:HK97 family phage prohead protease